MFKRLNEKLQKYVESNLPEIQKLDVICINRLYNLTAKIYVGKKANTWSIFRDKRENGEYNYYRISPRFDKEKEAIEWYANNLLDQYGEEDLYKALKSGNIKVVNDELKAELGISSFKEAVADWKPYKFTVDYDDGRPEDIIEYGMDAEDAKQNLFKSHKYLQEKPEKVSDGELVREDHKEVTLPFTMIHRSSEGPDASGEVTFFPTPFGYEYKCTEKDFNGRGPQWSTIRTIEGIKIWFRNVLFEFGAKTVTIGDETWDIDDFPKNEELQLVDKADPDFQLGNAYIAKNKEDLINGLDKLTLGDTIGVFVNYLDEDGVTGELNVEMVDEDLFKISMEEYTKENADDWEGKDVLDTEFLTKEETIYQLNLILEHLEIIDKLNEDRLFPTKFDTLPKKDAKFNIGDKVNINGINGEIIKIKPMKMSDTSTYQIKLDNGKTVWRYEEEINESLNEDIKTEYAIIKFLKKYGFGTQEDLYNNIGAQPFVIDNTVKELLKQNKIKFDDTHGKINGWKLNESLNEEDDKFNYMMLDRLRQDCEYFLGFGNRNEKQLWAGNVKDQIAEMRKIYNKLPEKPEWISLEDIDNYERQMLPKDESLNEIKEITRDEWNKTPKDYKMIKNGKPYLVYLDNETHATVLGPCKIIDESLNEAEGIYDPRTILKAYNIEKAWIEKMEHTVGGVTQVLLFIINDYKQILDTHAVNKKDIYTYEPKENEYFLDRIRDTEDVITDYNLEPAQKLVDKWNESKQWESLKDYKEVGKILQNKKDGGFNVAEANEPMLNEDQPTLKSLLNNLAKYL